MKLTNRTGLPAALVKATSVGMRGSPQQGRISVTELIAPPQVRALSQRHWDEITEDVSDRIWAVMGTAVHQVMQHAAHDNTLSEERLVVEIDGWQLSGIPDLYEDVNGGTLSDWKNVSVWTIVHEGDGKPEWEQQVNCYRWLLERHGFPVVHAQIIAFLRDWIIRKAVQEPDYPKEQERVIPVKLWSMEETENYIRGKIVLHQAAADGAIAPCTSEEQWEKPTTYAVMKGLNKRASRVLDSETVAQQWAADNLKPTDKWRIETRPGEQVRCRYYCRVSQFCPQMQKVPA